MELIMKINRYFPITLMAVAILAGCAASKNSSLTEAHSSYNSASADPQVTNLAAVELQQASVTLNKADSAFSKGESADTVNQLAYIAKQQVGIAQEAAKRKTAELAVTEASAKREQLRLEARTAEADAAKQQVAISQETAVQQQALIAQQEMQLKELKAKKTERGLVITLGDVLFSTNKAQLKSGGMRNVQKLADFLKQYPQRKVLVEGFTDSTGSDSLNQELSERRANAVRTALVDMGISSDRINTRGYGKAFPIADNNTAASRQLNRRVEIVLSDENGNITPR